jgi:hypothetical protein
MNTLCTIKRSLIITLAALSLGFASASTASALRATDPAGSATMFGDGQETHGGPKQAPLIFLDGQETHGGPKR